jgi:chemotaxis protein histidine kinase CheA
LESEIDQAIDSLFVEKSGRLEKTSSSSVSSMPKEPPKADPEPQTGKAKPGGLENEIDDAIENLFVEKGDRSETAPTAPIDQTVSEPPVPDIASLSEKSETGSSSSGPKVGVDRPTREEGPIMRDPHPSERNIENLETHLLSLEWEINRDLIDKVISELGFLKKANQNNRAVFQVTDVMEKVAHSLAKDEMNITPESLRFLLEAKDGIKLLTGEFKDRDDYKTVILSGILARYQLMHEPEKTPTPAKEQGDMRSETEVVGVAKALRELSEELRGEIRQLGRIAQELQQGRRSQAVSDETVGAVLFESCGRVFAVEKENLVRSVQIPFRMVRTVWRDKEIRIRGVRLPLVNLFRLFKVKGQVEAKDRPVVVIKKGDRTLAILADRLLSKKDIPLKHIREEKGFAYIRAVGSLGSGRTIYFLDLDRLTVEF